ncbi:hypothetical protein JXO59_03545 [candidate division KSB1 bacterium]|nr:hypothetical protein [candidate division KSB1 bacterium]
MKPEEIKKVVRENYRKIANQQSSCCQPAVPCCCGEADADVITKSIGYTENELKTVPEGSNLGLGCGNPLFGKWAAKKLKKYPRRSEK